MTVWVEDDSTQGETHEENGRQRGKLVCVSNLPETALYGDIRNLFRELHIPDGGIKIISNQDCEAFVLFATVNDAKEAAKRDLHTLGGRVVRVSLSHSNDMREHVQRSVRRVLEFESKRPVLISNRKIRPTRLDGNIVFKSDVFRPAEITHSGDGVTQSFGPHPARKIHPTSVAEYQRCSKLFSPRCEDGIVKFKRRKVNCLQ